jgi:hypothetical protein
MQHNKIEYKVFAYRVNHGYSTHIIYVILFSMNPYTYLRDLLNKKEDYDSQNLYDYTFLRNLFYGVPRR